MMKKHMLIPVLTGAISLAFATAAFAGEWKRDNIGWWYQKDTDAYSSSGWDQIDGVWYYFDSNGYMLADTTTPDGYYVDASGAWTENLGYSGDTAANVIAPNRSATWGYDEITLLSNSSSKAIKHDGYYEITNVELVVADTLEKSYVESLELGDTITVDNEKYTLTEISSFYGRMWYTFVNTDRRGYKKYWNYIEFGDAYRQGEYMETMQEKTIYTGNVYMSPNCSISLMDETDISKNKSVSVDSFIDNGLGGRYGNGLGAFITLDSNGIITSIKEYYRG